MTGPISASTKGTDALGLLRRAKYQGKTTIGSNIEPTAHRMGRAMRRWSASKSTQRPASDLGSPHCQLRFLFPPKSLEGKGKKERDPQNREENAPGVTHQFRAGVPGRRGQRHRSRPGDGGRINGLLARYANPARGGEQLAARRTLKRLAGEFRNGSGTIGCLRFRFGQARPFTRLLSIEPLCPLARCFHPSLFLVPAFVLLPV